MDIEICKIVLEHRQQLVPAIFTECQADLIQKYIHHQKLTPSEQTYFYSAIRRKMEALKSLQEKYYITGGDMIPQRVEQAKNILKILQHEKAFISGSFLYKKEYNDIDIFVVRTRRKSYRMGNKHFTCITEKDLHQPIFASAAKYSVATFSAVVNVIPKRGKFDELLFVYQWVINQILDGEDQKEIRDLIFQYFMYIKKDILDARSLDLKVIEIKNLAKEEKIKMINQITREILLQMFSVKYLYNAFSIFIKSVKKMGEEYKTDNILIFLNFAKEVQYECRRAQA